MTLAMMLPMVWVAAQDDVAFTNYWQFQSFYNPAAAGRTGLLDINASYRMEMFGFEDAGQTMLIQGDLPMFFVPKAEIVEKNYAFSFGRYADVVQENDDGEPFEEKMMRLTSELAELFDQSHKLETDIRQKLEAIGYGI